MTIAAAAAPVFRRPLAALLALLAGCALLVAVVAFVAVGRPFSGAGGARPLQGPASLADAPAAFLAGYEEPDGRVVRHDQGGDTVSEGQAYAMLVAAESGQRARFDAAWSWAQAHLLQPDGLLAWRWVDGHVVDAQPATDADLGAAAALVDAGRRFADPADVAAGRRLADAIARRELVGSGPSTVVAAGPWATVTPVRVNPSYLATPELATLASLGGPWPAALDAARHQLAGLVQGGTLPSDWAIVGSDGAVHPAAPPSDPSAPVRFGYDAARVPLWLAQSCDGGDRALAASLLPTLQRSGGEVGLDLGGRPSPGQATTLGHLALAAAAMAAGPPAAPTASAAVTDALHDDRSNPTYFGTAWLALADLGLPSHPGSCTA